MAITLTGIWVVALLLAAAIGKWRVFEGAGHPKLARLIPTAAAVMLVMAWVYIVRSPWDDWNAARTAWAVAWAKGQALYFPTGQGPANDFMYGPIAAIVRLPAAWMSSPTGAILVADVINVALFFIPAILFLRSLRGERVMTILAIITFIGFSLTMESLSYSAFAVHADAPALGFAMLAMWMSLRRATIFSLALAALFTTLSIGSKHTFATLLIALPAYLWLARSRRDALTLIVMQFVLLAATVGISIRVFGSDAIVHQLISIPSHQPWQLAQYGGTAAIFLMTGWLLIDLALPLGVLVFAILFFEKSRAIMLPLLIAIVLLPGALLARVKIGGNANTYSAVSYFVVAALCAWIASYRTSQSNSKIVVGGAQFLCIVLAISSLLPWQKLVESYGFIAKLSDNPQEIAFRFSKSHPKQAYFPWNPLSTLLSDGRYYHFDYGLVDRWLAKEIPSHEQMLLHTPPGMKWMIFPPNAFETEDARQFLPEYRNRVHLDELPGWRVYTADERNE